MTQVTDNFEQLRQMQRTNDCGECGSELTIRVDKVSGVYELVCARFPLEHNQQNFQVAEPPGMLATRDGETAGQLGLARYMSNETEARRAILAVQTKFQAQNLTILESAYFLGEYFNRGVNPLVGEAVPAAFRNKDQRDRQIVLIETEQGVLSIAKRGDPARYVSTPNVQPIMDAEKREAICGDPKAHVWEAKGKIMVNDQMIDSAPTWGWVLSKDFDSPRMAQIAKDNLPNQARVRAIKRWTKENFPDSFSVVAEQYQRNTGGDYEGEDLVVHVIDQRLEVLPAAVQKATAAERSEATRTASALPSKPGEARASVDPATGEIMRCPVHDVEWRPTKYGEQHPVESGGWCKPNQAYSDILKALASDMNVDAAALNELMKAQYGGKTASKLTALELAQFVNGQRLLSTPAATEPDPAEETPAEEPESGASEEQGVSTGDPEQSQETMFPPS